MTPLNRYVFFILQFFLVAQIECQESAYQEPLEKLKLFAAKLVSSNRTLIKAHHELESSRQRAGKNESGFMPVVQVQESAAHVTNKDYNTITGIDQDYSTRRRGMGASISQKTFLGNASLDLEKSKTQYTIGDTSFFESAYVSLTTDLLRRDALINSAERKVARGNYQTQLVRTNSILLDTLSGALNVLIDRLLSDQTTIFKKRNLEFYKKMLEEASVKLENGLGSELDLKQAKMKLTQAETDLEESELNLLEIDRRLGLLFGESKWEAPLVDLNPADIASLVPEIFDEAALASKGLSLRPDIQLFESEIKTRRQEFFLAKELNKPEVKLQSRWGKQGRANDPSIAHEKRDKSWDVTISWTTTLGHRPEGFDYRIARENLRALETQHHQAVQNARNAISEQISRIQFHRKSLLNMRESLLLSAQILEGQQMNFSLGKTSLLDLLRYQSDYESSRLSVIRAEAAFAKSYLQLLYELGELPVFLSVQLSPPPKKTSIK